MTQSHHDILIVDEPPVDECWLKFHEFVESYSEDGWRSNLERWICLELLLLYVKQAFSEEEYPEQGIEGVAIRALAIFALSTMKLVPEKPFTGILNLDLPKA